MNTATLPTPITHHASRFTARWYPGGHAVQFHSRGFSLVPQDEQTTFPSVEAVFAAVKKVQRAGGARGGYFMAEAISDGSDRSDASDRSPTHHHPSSIIHHPL